MNLPTEERSEIVFFDTETTVPSFPNDPHHLLEFGAVLLCRWRLVELENYTTPIKPTPSVMNGITSGSVICKRILRDVVATAPSFLEVAEKIYDILHGRVWAGHNIVTFDCVRIEEAFAAIGRPAPEPKGTIDTLTLLTERFGKRAGNMKLAGLATYLGLGQQAHRSLDDVRMNVEVLKYCSTVLFLESSLPNILMTHSWVSPNSTARSQSDRSAFHGGRILDAVPSVLTLEENQTVSPLNAMPEPSKADERMEETSAQASLDTFASAVANEGCSGYAGYVEPDKVSVPSISASLVPSRWGPTIQLLHNVVLQLYCANMRLRFGISKKFNDRAGRPRMSIVLDSPTSLCTVLDVCDYHSQKLFVDYGSGSSWRPVVTRNNDFTSTIRLKIPTISNESHGSSSVYATEIYKRDATGTSQRLVFNDPAQLDSLFVPGASIDAFFSLNVYDYQQSAGIRLVATKLIINA